MPQNAANLETAPFGIPVANASGSALTSVTLNDGQVLIGSTGNAPVAATLTAGSDVTITNGPGSIEIAAAGGGGTGDVVWTEIKTVVFTSSGTYTPPAGLQFIMIEAVGAGGSVEPPIPGLTPIETRGGGSAGPYCLGFRTVAQIGGSATVTVGAPTSTAGGSTTYVDSTGTLTSRGGQLGAPDFGGILRLSVVAIAFNETDSAGTWLLASRPGGGGSPGLIYEGSSMVKGLVSGGGAGGLGVGFPKRFVLGPASTNQDFNPGSGKGYGSGGGGYAYRRVSGSNPSFSSSGLPGVLIITEFVV